MAELRNEGVEAREWRQGLEREEFEFLAKQRRHH